MNRQQTTRAGLVFMLDEWEVWKKRKKKKNAYVA